MPDLTPEKLAELRQLLADSTIASPGPWRRIGERVDDRDRFEVGAFICEQDAALVVAAVDELPALLDAAAERDRLAESVRAYGRTIDRWGLLIIAATHSTTPDGDGDWEVIESRLAEVPALLAERDALAAKLEAVRALADEMESAPPGELMPVSGGALLIRAALDAETGGES